MLRGDVSAHVHNIQFIFYDVIKMLYVYVVFNI